MVEKLITVNVIFSGKAGAGRGGIAKKGFATFAILRVEIFLLFRKAEESRCFCRAPSSLSPSLWIVSYIREEERGAGRERERGREDSVFDDKHRVPLRKLSLVFVAFRTNPRARSAEFLVCMHLPLCIVISQFPIYISSQDRIQLIPWNGNNRRDHLLRPRLILRYFIPVKPLFWNFEFATTFPSSIRTDSFFFRSLSGVLHFPSFLSTLQFTSNTRKYLITRNRWYSIVRINFLRGKCLQFFPSPSTFEILSPVIGRAIGEDTRRYER